MLREFRIQKAAIIVIVSALIVGDVALGIVSWKRASEQTAQHQLMMLQQQLNVLKADIARAKEIQREIPAVQKDCEKFEHSLYPAATGYSSVTADLSVMASKAGLRIVNRSFRPSEVKGRGLIEVDIDAAVSGNYNSIVHFLNELQRSPNMYAVGGLSARSDAQAPTSGGLLSVALYIKTYFRAA